MDHQRAVQRAIDRIRAAGILGLALAAFGIACGSPAPDRLVVVGRAERAFSDAARRSWSDAGPRPVATTIWYPAVRSAQQVEWTTGPPGLPLLRNGFTATDAAFMEGGERFPLVLLSPGTGADTASLSWLAEALVAAGHVVAGVTHHASSMLRGDARAEGFFLWWERTDDLRVALDALLADTEFGPRIDAARIGAAGFSIGGHTVLQLAGGRVDIDAYYEMCARPDAEPTSCELPEGLPFGVADFIELRETDARVKASVASAGRDRRDARVRAVYAMAPALVESFSVTSLRAIPIPTRIAAGLSDAIAPAAINAHRAAREIPGATLLDLPGAGHFVFLSRCTKLGTWLLGDMCREQPDASRREHQGKVADDAGAFFMRFLAPPGA